MAIIQLKDNQPTLLNEAVAACAAMRSLSSGVSVCKARIRHETRTAEVFRAKPAVAGTEWETLVQTIVRVNRTVLHRSPKSGLWPRTSEAAHYPANVPAPAKRCAEAIRGHWHIENTLHYTRNVTFQEDQSRIRRNKVASSGHDRYAAALRGVDALLKWKYSYRALNSPGERTKAGVWSLPSGCAATLACVHGSGRDDRTGRPFRYGQILNRGLACLPRGPRQQPQCRRQTLQIDSNPNHRSCDAVLTSSPSGSGLRPLAPTGPKSAA